jgi:DNA-binding beta-propeller fold protein YncE
VKIKNILSTCLVLSLLSVGSTQFTATSSLVAATDPEALLSLLGRADGLAGNAGAEIASLDTKEKRLYVTNGATTKIDIFNVEDPDSPLLITSVSLSALGATDIQSVTAKNGLVAVATSVGGDKQAPGKIFLLNSDGEIDARAPEGIVVGSLPDSVHFTPDGKKLVTANEGEPLDYCLVDGVLPLTKDPHGSISIIDLAGNELESTTLDFSAFDDDIDAIKSAGGRIFGPNASVSQDIEPEYVAITPDSTTAFVTLQENNAVAKVDLTTGEISRIFGLGYKDHSQPENGLDASDKDSATSTAEIKIEPRNVKGMYLPDAIRVFEKDGETYFVTANEGDAREYPCLLGGTDPSDDEAEDSRVASVGVAAPLELADAANGVLGRLKVTTMYPATYDDAGDFTSLYSFGTRSITVWKEPQGNNSPIAPAELVSDTGDDFEQLLAVEIPTYFNADWNTSTGRINALDARSTSKGPEPEGLTVGAIAGHQYAFVGFERVGGVAMVDISDPAAPVVVDYLNTSDPTAIAGPDFKDSVTSVTGLAGDVSPEGLSFVRASDSPNGRPMIVISHELSGTTSMYEVGVTATVPAKPTNVLLEPGNKSIKVTWTAPHDDGGTALTGIVATATPGGFTCEAQGARNTCTIRNLMNGSRYRVQVSAVNGQGVGVPSLRSEGTDLMVTVAKNGKTRLTNLISVSTSALKTWSVTGNGCSITSDKAFLKVPNRVGATCVLKLRVAARGAQPARSYFLNVKTR